MAKPIHALDFLAAETTPTASVSALFGGDAFLKRQALVRLRDELTGGDQGDFSLATLPGDDANTLWRDVIDELATVAMFGGGKRIVILEDADDFVTRYREQLEDYVERPARTGALVLLVDSLPANTRLYKAIAASGLLVDCAAPAANRLVGAISDWATRFHKLKLPSAAAESLIEIVGPELGLIDQELAKLALVVGADRKVSVEMVAQMVGGWRAKTTWIMLDAALAGDVRGALEELDRLLAAGETPIGLLSQVAASLRRLAAATRLILQAEAAGRRIALREALERAGVKPFVLQKSERDLKRLTRGRGSKLFDWLLEADLDLKGDSSLPPRLILERLIVRVAAPAQAPVS